MDRRRAVLVRYSRRILRRYYQPYPRRSTSIWPWVGAAVISPFVILLIANGEKPRPAPIEPKLNVLILDLKASK